MLRDVLRQDRQWIKIAYEVRSYSRGAELLGCRLLLLLLLLLRKCDLSS